MRPFRSWLSNSFERFVAIKRAGGAQYITQERLLGDFDRFLQAHTPEPPLARETLSDYLASLERLSPRGRQNVVDVLWQALTYARSKGERIEPLPLKPPSPPPGFRLREPRLVSVSEIQAILIQARRLEPVARIRPATYSTLLGLLFATGLRIGETLALDVGDVDLEEGLLTVRRGKFGKKRVLPLHRSTTNAIEQYVLDPRRPIGTGSIHPLFVSGLRRRLSCNTVLPTFRRLCIAAGVAEPTPRLHDLRHSFVVLRVERWYREGKDVNVLLPVLSTYLGHVSVENTRSYLRANSSLLMEASQRFSDRTVELDGVFQ